MTPERILDTLAEAEVELFVSGADLRVRAPRGALTGELKSLIVENKRALIDHLESGGVAGIPRTWHGEETGLSYMQERMWYFSKAGLASAYNVVAAYHLEGPFDHEAMRRAIAAVVARHATLRSYVVEREGRPYLRYLTSVEVDLPVEDLSGVPEGDRMAACHDRIRLYFHDFDVSSAPLFYFKVFRLSDTACVLYCNLHHALTDAFSFSVLVREIAQGYAAYAAGREPDFPELRLQFPDWIRWQHEHQSRDRLGDQLDWWDRTLARPLPTFDLPPDRPRRSAFDLSGADMPFSIPPETVDRMAAVGRSVGATPYMVIMACLKLAIHYLTGADDVIVGTPVAGRVHPDLKKLIGGFLNTISVRSRIDPDWTLRQFLAAVKDHMLGALAHQDVPFNEVVRRLSLPHDPSRTPVYQVSLNLWDISDRPVQWGDLQATRFHVATPWTHAEFAMWLMKSDGEGIQGTCTYSTELFDEPTARRLTEAVHQVLERYLDDPDVRVGDVSLRTDAEGRAAERWNDTTRPVPDIPLHDYVLARPAAAPEREVVRDDARVLTGGQLVEASARVAASLRAAGVVPGDLVGVLVERDARVLPLLIGILRAGAAYLPLDPEFPAERLRFIVEDSGVAAVVCSPETRDAVPDGPEALDLDGLAAGQATHDDVVVAPDHPAYVIYTSGSTGRPKGVRVTHRNVVNFLAAMEERPGLSAEDVVVASTAFSFDISALELYLPLAVGARVVVASRDQVEFPDEFTALLGRWRPTVVQATPSFWKMLFESGWRGNPSLKVLCGGEALPRDLAARLLECTGELWNMYGPTETTVWSTVHRVAAGDLGRPSIPIGTPIGNTQVLVVDEELRPVPVGVVGELLVGGVGVAEGYHGRPDLTADRFVEVAPWGRMYRTGDRVRHIHTGSLEYHGRVDWQLKLRGHRIEPGEIEAALRTHESVRDAVVGTREIAVGDDRLVAWVVREGAVSLTASQVRSHLRRTLPEYMIPNLVLELDEIPRTPNGKIDRGALPDPTGRAAGSGAGFRPPETDSERLLAEVWSELLQVERVGKDDNFFELGGHSLLSVQAVAAVEKRMGLRPDPRGFFFYSLEQLATWLDEDAGVVSRPGASGP